MKELARWRSRWDKLPACTSNDDELLAKKHWEWQEERNPVLRHVGEVRPTMCLASFDIKTAFDEAKPKHVAHILDCHDTNGWLIAAFLREMSGLEGNAMFECVESSFIFNRCLRQGSMEAPRLWQKMVTLILAKVVEERMRKRSGILLDIEGERVHQICSFMWVDNFLDHVALKRKFGTNVTRID